MLDDDEDEGPCAKELLKNHLFLGGFGDGWAPPAVAEAEPRRWNSAALFMNAQPLRLPLLRMLSCWR